MDGFEIGKDESAAYAAGRCALAGECCDGRGVEQCSESASQELEVLFSLGSQLSYSEDCYEHVLSNLHTDVCADTLSVTTCVLATGSGVHGDTCTSVLTPFFSGTTCSEGLQCLAGRCVDEPLLAFVQGEVGDYCSPYDPCLPTLFCTPDQRCVERAGRGESCLGAGHCRAEPGLFCSIEDGMKEGQCEPQRPEGEDCSFEEQCLLECTDESCVLQRCEDGECVIRPIPACDFQD